MRTWFRNVLPWVGIVAGAEVIGGAGFAWIRYLSGPSLRIGHGLPDFFIYSALGRQLQARGFSGLYDLDVQLHYQQQVSGTPSTILPYISPPYVAPLWWPFGSLDLKTGYIVWASITIVLIATSLALVVAGSGLERRAAWGIGLLAAAWLPSLVTVLQGQTTGLVLLGLALIAVAWKARREFAAGASALLTLVRPHMALAIPLLFLLRGRRALAGLAVGTTLLVLITYPFIGFDTWRAYLHLVVPWLVQGATLPGVAFEQAPYSLRGLLENSGASAPVIALALGAGAALTVAALLQKPAKPALDLALAVTASVVLSPHQNLHDLLLLTVPLTLTAGMQKRRADLGWIAIAVCYLGVEASLFNPLLAPLGMLVLLAYLFGERLWPLLPRGQ